MEFFRVVEGILAGAEHDVLMMSQFELAKGKTSRQPQFHCSLIKKNEKPRRILRKPFKALRRRLQSRAALILAKQIFARFVFNSHFLGSTSKISGYRDVGFKANYEVRWLLPSSWDSISINLDFKFPVKHFSTVSWPEASIRPSVVCTISLR